MPLPSKVYKIFRKRAHNKKKWCEWHYSFLLSRPHEIPLLFLPLISLNYFGDQLPVTIFYLSLCFCISISNWTILILNSDSLASRSFLDLSFKSAISTLSLVSICVNSASLIPANDNCWEVYLTFSFNSWTWDFNLISSSTSSSSCIVFLEGLLLEL